jgi:hypothetical protein
MHCSTFFQEVTEHNPFRYEFLWGWRSFVFHSSLSSGSQWWTKVSSPLTIRLVFPSKRLRISLETLFQLASHLSIIVVPTWQKFSELKKVLNVSDSFLRDSQFKRSVFLFDSTIFSNNFFNEFLLRLVCCCHWPYQPWFVTRTCSPPPPSCLNCCAQRLTVLMSTLFFPMHCLRTAINDDGRNFFRS